MKIEEAKVSLRNDNSSDTDSIHSQLSSDCADRALRPSQVSSDVWIKRDAVFR